MASSDISATEVFPRMCDGQNHPLIQDCLKLDTIGGHAQEIGKIQ